MHEIYSKKNLEKAWGWIKSNPDRTIKDVYNLRNIYGEFETIKDDFISQLQRDLKRGTYRPTPPGKVFLPKPSGLLRPYTILSVRDQVVYQAIINLIAEKLSKKIGSRYGKIVFGNMYAGKDSIWFYQKWQSGYAAFNQSARKAHMCGKKYIARFDFTACYDSLDQGVLMHYIEKLGFDLEFRNFLSKCLSAWTVTDHDEAIYQHHGIPQGPLSSGLLSEVVLQAFDSTLRRSGVVYLRYVDDIFLLGDNENVLRHELVELDRVSKKVGLFPQSSKINVKKISNIEDELKQVSGGAPEDPNNLDFDEIENQIYKITSRYKITDVSKFKYLVSKCYPSGRIINRLWEIYARFPHFYNLLCSVLKKKGAISENNLNKVLEALRVKSPYKNIQAEFIKVLLDVDLTGDQALRVAKFIKREFYIGGQVIRAGDAVLSSSVFSFLIKYDFLTEKQISYVCDSPHWYVRSQILRYVKPKNSEILRKLVSDPVLDVQLSAASRIVSIAEKPPKYCGSQALIYFKKFGLKSMNKNTDCIIGTNINEIFALRSSIAYNWKKFFGEYYKQAIVIIVSCNSSKTTNPGAWLNEMDAFNDLVIKALYLHNPTFGTLRPGDDMGSALNVAITSPFRRKFKIIHDNFDKIHQRRVTSITSHAISKKSNSPNTKFKFSEIKKYLALESSALSSVVAISLP